MRIKRKKLYYISPEIKIISVESSPFIMNSANNAGTGTNGGIWGDDDTGGDNAGTGNNGGSFGDGGSSGGNNAGDGNNGGTYGKSKSNNINW